MLQLGEVADDIWKSGQAVAGEVEVYQVGERSNAIWQGPQMIVL